MFFLMSKEKRLIFFEKYKIQEFPAIKFLYNNQSIINFKKKIFKKKINFLIKIKFLKCLRG